jgi:hypothetical protein
VRCGNITNYFGENGEYTGCHVQLNETTSCTLNAEGKTISRIYNFGNQTVIDWNMPKLSIREMSNVDREVLRRKFNINDTEMPKYSLKQAEGIDRKEMRRKFGINL